LSAFLVSDIYNNQNAYYESTFIVDNIESFEDSLLIDEEFLNGIKNSGANGKYQNINIEEMLGKTDFTYTIENNTITIKTKYKYYDTFFLSSSNSVGTRAKMFIKDTVSKIAEDRCLITFNNPTDIVELHNSVNHWNISLITTITVFGIELIATLFLYNRNNTKIEEVCDNKTIFNHCFHKEYWKLALKPFKSVKEITTIAMFFALMLLSKFIPIPSGFGNLGLSFTYLFFALICMIYGPTVGFIIGIFSDILGFFLTGSNGGAFNLGYTLQAALTGFIYGICLYRTKLTFSKVLLSRFLVNLLMNTILGSFLFIFVMYYNTSDTMTFNEFLKMVESYMLLISLPKNIIYLLPQSLLLFYVIKILSPTLIRFKLIEPKSIKKVEK
jgi:ECF transporter S component (folate family)